MLNIKLNASNAAFQIQDVLIKDYEIKLDRMTRALDKAKEYLAKIAYWKSDANVCCFPIDFDKSEKEIEAIKRGEK